MIRRKFKVGRHVILKGDEERMSKAEAGLSKQTSPRPRVGQPKESRFCVVSGRSPST